ncbi:N-lysine methyltransferase KMT5A [Pimephales promelas]|nr:N-lysine methyltransferase KMT5A [Pimephales promelas]
MCKRKMRPKRVSPEKEALYFIASGKDKDTFEKKLMCEEKGFGVIATKHIEPGEFLLEYVGRHMAGSEGETLLKDYSAEDAGQSYCVDGSKATENLGRYINDDHIKPNSKIKIIMDEKKMPHLCVFALTKIKPIIPKKKSYQSLWTSMQE